MPDSREGCESGRIGTLGKRVWGNSPWVRIPLPPPSHRSTLVGGSHFLRHAHAPRVHEQLPQLVDVDGIEPDTDPPVPHVGTAGHDELLRLRGNERLALLAGKAEAHDRLVLGECGVDDAPDSEPHFVAHHRLVGTRERGGDRPGVVDRHPHRGYRTPASSSSFFMETPAAFRADTTCVMTAPARENSSATIRPVVGEW